MSVEQIRVGGDNFGYVIYCERSKEAALVDPGMDASKVLQFIELKKLKLINYLLKFFSFILIVSATTERMPSRKNRLYPEIAPSESTENPIIL